MSAERAFYVFRELNWTVIVDTDNETAAVFTAAEANRQRGFCTEMESVNPVSPVCEMRDPDLLGDPQEYRGIKYWII
jgi:hypothetical protein